MFLTALLWTQNIYCIWRFRTFYGEQQYQCLSVWWKQEQIMSVVMSHVFNNWDFKQQKRAEMFPLYISPCRPRILSHLSGKNAELSQVGLYFDSSGRIISYPSSERVNTLVKESACRRALLSLCSSWVWTLLSSKLSSSQSMSSVQQVSSALNLISDKHCRRWLRWMQLAASLHFYVLSQ